MSSLTFFSEPLQRRNEPLQYAFHAVLLGRALRDGRKQRRVFAPVRRKLGQRDGGENDYMSVNVIEDGTDEISRYTYKEEQSCWRDPQSCSRVT